MTEDCCCAADEIMILPCSGASNCGQITNSVATNLDTLGMGNMYCLAGIGAHIEGMVESARSVKRILVLDGCKVACARALVEHAGLSVTDWICVVEEGIEKKHDFLLEQEDIERISDLAKSKLNS